MSAMLPIGSATMYSVPGVSAVTIPYRPFVKGAIVAHLSGGRGVRSFVNDELICPNCGSPNAPGRRVCVACGAELDTAETVIDVSSETPWVVQGDDAWTGQPAAGWVQHGDPG